MKKDKNVKFDVEIDDSEIQKEFAKLENEKNELLNKNVELLNDLQRTRADFENYRKQIEMQKENDRKSAKMATVMKFLPLIDDMDRAIATYSELEPLKKTLEKSLKDLGLSKISSEKDVEFNPDLHEAVMTEGDGDAQLISETLRPGYMYENEVLRPAMVKVICR